MITIGKPTITIAQNTAYLKAPVSISKDTVQKYLQVTGELPNCSWLTDVDYPSVFREEDSSLWFAVDVSFAASLSDRRSNAFVLAMFWYAMACGSDICFDAPMSERLYRGLTEKLMPALAENGFSPISLSGPLISDRVAVYEGFATGMSCGVDSFYTLHCYESRLTHLTFYSGSGILPYVKRPYRIDEIFEDRERTFSEYIARAQAVAEKRGLPFVAVNTNLDRDFYRGGYVYSAMYRHTACSLALEKLFTVYISSSSGHREHTMEVSLFSPTQLYEDLLCDCLQTESFRYMTSDHDLRVDKIKAIADDKDFQRSAEVCFNQTQGQKNCGKCFGCWKTMIPLDMLGKLDQFRDSFDLEEYDQDRRKVFSDLIRFSFLPEAASAKDMVEQLVSLAKAAPSEAGHEYLSVWRDLSG